MAMPLAYAGDPVKRAIERKPHFRASAPNGERPAGASATHGFHFRGLLLLRINVDGGGHALVDPGEDRLRVRQLVGSPELVLEACR